ncbi:MAG: MliC family protein [Notoacmeibacter sp.]|nr:MliC family protein [Notoacmeibacter sp.]
MMNPRAAIARIPLFFAAVTALSGCVSGGYESAGRPGAMPRIATYNCDGAGPLRVENLGRSVKLLTPRGLEVTLPASPPDSTTRYGNPPYALVLDGREALWFVTGKEPLACRR